MTAVNPQITKSYSSGNHEYMMTLIYQGARLSFYILLFLSWPILVNTHYVLWLWLGQVPEHTVLFIRLVLVFTMCESISNPLITAMLATGKIRNYQLVVGGLQMMNLPVSYLLLRYGAIPETVLIVAIVISQLCLASRLYMLKDLINLDAILFLKKVYFNVIMVAVSASIIPVMISLFLEESFTNFIILVLISIITVLLSEFYIGCNSDERKFVISKVRSLKHKFIHDKY